MDGGDLGCASQNIKNRFDDAVGSLCVMSACFHWFRVAEQKLAEWVKEREREAVGLSCAADSADTFALPLSGHVEPFLEDLRGKGQGSLDGQALPQFAAHSLSRLRLEVTSGCDGSLGLQLAGALQPGSEVHQRPARGDGWPAALVVAPAAPARESAGVCRKGLERVAGGYRRRRRRRIHEAAGHGAAVPFVGVSGTSLHGSETS